MWPLAPGWQQPSEPELPASNTVADITLEMYLFASNLDATIVPRYNTPAHLILKPKT